MVLQGSVIGVIRILAGENSLEFVDSHLFSGFMVFSTYFVFTNYPYPQLGKRFTKFISLLGYTTLILMIITFLFFLYRWNIGVGLIWGFNSGQLGLPFAWFLANRKIKSAILTFVIVLIISSVLYESNSRSMESISAKRLNKTALPSMTGFDARAPKFPNPSIAEPLLITATKFPLDV